MGCHTNIKLMMALFIKPRLSCGTNFCIIHFVNQFHLFMHISTHLLSVATTIVKQSRLSDTTGESNFRYGRISCATSGLNPLGNPILIVWRKTVWKYRTQNRIPRRTADRRRWFAWANVTCWRRANDCCNIPSTSRNFSATVLHSQ